VVFLTRYLDLFWSYISLYNTVMKIFFIASSLYTCYMMHFTLRATNQKEKDSFRVEFLILPCVILAFIATYDYTPVEILWSFSVWLESGAILPQLYMLQTTGEAETITAHYLFALGAYRALYLVNWIYRFYTEGYADWIVWVAGSIQTLLYADFFYLYITKVLRGESLLPK